jgi:hypothetical protein
MIAFVTVVFAFPLGYLIRSRVAANVAYIAVYSYAFTFQGVYLMRAWVGGDHSAFPKDPDDLPLEYLAVSLAIYAVGFGLVRLGGHVRTRRSQGRGTAAAPAPLS